MTNMNVYLYQRILGTGVLLLQIAIVVVLLLAIMKKDSAIKAHLQEYGMRYGLAIGIFALLGSLGLSEVYLLEPCRLCWFQRIFHYPQIILFAVAIKAKDLKVWSYSIWLAGIGLVISLYQILIQFSPTIAQSSLCSTNPSVASCSDILSMEYGFITIPVMSATLYLAMIVLYKYRKKA